MRHIEHCLGANRATIPDEQKQHSVINGKEIFTSKKFKIGSEAYWFWSVISLKQSECIVCPHFKTVEPLIESKRYWHRNKMWQVNKIPMHSDHLWQKQSRDIPHNRQDNSSSWNSQHIHDYHAQLLSSKILQFYK